MTCISKRATGFFIKLIIFTLLLTSCKNEQLGVHLKHLKEQNKLIEIEGWEVTQQFQECKMESFSLKKEVDDTSFRLNFYCIDNFGDKTYVLGDLIKSYTNDSLYVEMSLLNRDTLYLFTYKKDDIVNEPGHSIQFKNMVFQKGKYYFMYKHGNFTMNQQEFFENNKDSLTKVRGNNLPVLCK